MYVLNIWHNVADYAQWKKTFDSDPLGREASGVRRYAIERPTDDEHMVIGHLEFDSREEAEAFSGRLQDLWRGEASRFVSNAGLNITETLESKELGGESARRAA